jgi:hypothetical protein
VRWKRATGGISTRRSATQRRSLTSKLRGVHWAADGCAPDLLGAGLGDRLFGQAARARHGGVRAVGLIRVAAGLQQEREWRGRERLPPGSETPPLSETWLPPEKESLVFVSAIVLGPLGAWQVPRRYRSRPTTFVPSQFWPDAVRTAVVDALAEALVQDVLTPPLEPGLGETST